MIIPRPIHVIIWMKNLFLMFRSEICKQRLLMYEKFINLQGKYFDYTKIRNFSVNANFLRCSKNVDSEEQTKTTIFTQKTIERIQFCVKKKQKQPILLLEQTKTTNFSLKTNESYCFDIKIATNYIAISN